MRRFLFISFLLLLSNTSAVPQSSSGVPGDIQIEDGSGGFGSNGTNGNKALVKVKGESHFSPRNPYVDVTLFGVRAVNPATTPAAVGLTANCTKGSTAVPISSASTLQNGDGVTLYGCGAPNSMATPSGLQVTNGVASGPTGTGIVVTGLAGTTKRCYKLVARNTYQGLTAASTEVCRTNGAATLGEQSNANSALSRNISTNVVTVTTSSAHGLPVGCASGNCPIVFIYNTSDDEDFGGWQVLDSVPTSTTFTYTNGRTIAGGASASAIGGTTYYWLSDHLNFGSPGPGVWQYGIYEGPSGAETLVGLSIPQITLLSDDPTAYTWDYYGSTMSGRGIFAPFWPTAPPSMPTSNSLTTTIVSGAGTTTLVLSTPPSTNSTGATILFDDAPNIAAAAAAAMSTDNGGGMLYFPAPTSQSGVVLAYVTNSYLNLSQVGVSQAGAFYANDTVQYRGKWRGDLTLNYQQCAEPQFALACHIPIIANYANPGIYFQGGSMQGVTLSCNGNSFVCMFYSVGQPSLLSDMTFSDASPVADYMGILLYDFEPYVAGGFGTFMRNITFTTGPSNEGGVGTTATPLYAIKNNAELNYEYVSMAHRGIFLQANPTGSSFDFNQGEEEQGGIMPMLSLYHCGSTASFAVKMHNAIEDTMQQPLVSNLGCSLGAVSGSLSVDYAYPPSAGMALLSGRAFNSVYVYNSPALTPAQLGQDFNLEFTNTVPPVSKIFDEPVFIAGSTGKLGIGQIANPTAAPTVSVTTACTGHPGAGTYSFGVVAWDITSIQSTAIGNSTLVGPASLPIVLNGISNCAVITQPNLPAGAAYWGVVVVSGPGAGNYIYAENGSACGPSFVPSSVKSFTYQTNYFCGGRPSVNTTALQILDANSVYHTSLSLLPSAASPTSFAGVTFFDLNSDNWPAFNANKSSNKNIIPGSVYYSLSPATNSDIKATTMVASTSAQHDYLFSWTVSLKTIGSGCSGSTTVILNEIHTDPNASASVTVPVATITLANSGNGTVGFVASGANNILAKNGTAVQYSTSAYSAGRGCTVNPAYVISPTLLQLW
jgi:hypothetical protein